MVVFDSGTGETHQSNQSAPLLDHEIKLLIERKLRTINTYLHTLVAASNPIRWGALKAIIEHVPKQANRYELINYYLTCNGIFNIVSAEEETTVSAALRKMFVTRECIFENDNYEYCVQPEIPTNRLCHRVASLIAAAGETVYDILYQTTMSKRSVKWEDIVSGETDLAQCPHDVFRSGHHFHLYSSLVERAIFQLEKGETDLKQIWLAGDNLDTNQPLSFEELNLLKRRAPALQTLIEYTEGLARQAKNNSQNLYERLLRFRKALRRGDASHEGNDYNAGRSAYIAVAEFSEWWNDLKNTPSGKMLRNEIENIGGGKLRKVFSIILDAYGKNEAYSCLEMNGSRLDKVLHCHRAQIYAADRKINFRVSSNQLNTWKQEITQQLKKPLESQQGRNVIWYFAISGGYLYHRDETIDLQGIIKHIILSPNCKSGHAILELALRNPDLLTDSGLESVLYALVNTQDYTRAKQLMLDHPALKGNHRPGILELLIHKTDMDLFRLLCRHEDNLKNTKQSILILAANTHRTDVMRYLLEHHASLFSDADIGKSLQAMARQAADIRSVDIDTIRSILQARPYCSINLIDDAAFLKLLERSNLLKQFLNKETLAFRDEANQSILNVAAKSTDPFLFDYLLEHHRDQFTSEDRKQAFFQLISSHHYQSALKLWKQYADEAITNDTEAGSEALFHLIQRPNYELIDIVCRNTKILANTKHPPISTALQNSPYNQDKLIGHFIKNYAMHISADQIQLAQTYAKKSKQRGLQKSLAKERPDVVPPHVSRRARFFNAIKRVFCCAKLEPEEHNFKPS